MKNSLKSLVLVSLCLSASSVVAAEYVVVRSNSPVLLKGAQLSAGQKLDLGPGQQVTVVSTGGELTVLRGAAGGVTLPVPEAGVPRASAAALSALVTRPAPRRSFGAMRGKQVCSAPDALLTLEGILAAGQVDACSGFAQQALDRWVAANESGQK